MKYLRSVLFGIFLFCGFAGLGQIRGLVRGVRVSDTLALNGVKVKLLRAKKAVFTDANGKFEIFPGKQVPDTLVALIAGYISDTIVINRADRYAAISLVLYSDKLKPEVIVQRKATNGVVKISIVQLERISSQELRRAACCNLSESFETNASVDVNIADAVSGARKIQLLGLDGVYTQFQLENVPFLRGLEAPFGMQSFSGIWLDGIQISK
jgi:outer membrane receptor for ferrienterochelin and colicins